MWNFDGDSKTEIWTSIPNLLEHFRKKFTANRSIFNTVKERKGKERETTHTHTHTHTHMNGNSKQSREQSREKSRKQQQDRQGTGQGRSHPALDCNLITSHLTWFLLCFLSSNS
jgi:TFIIF-interacting CTD phosphatase-like protein